MLQWVLGGRCEKQKQANAWLDFMLEEVRGKNEILNSLNVQAMIYNN